MRSLMMSFEFPKTCTFNIANVTIKISELEMYRVDMSLQFPWLVEGFVTTGTFMISDSFVNSFYMPLKVIFMSKCLLAQVTSNFLILGMYNIIVKSQMFCSSKFICTFEFLHRFMNSLNVLLGFISIN